MREEVHRELAEFSVNVWRQMDKCVGANMTVVDFSTSTKFTHSRQILEAALRHKKRRSLEKNTCTVCVTWWRFVRIMYTFFLLGGQQLCSV